MLYFVARRFLEAIVSCLPACFQLMFKIPLGFGRFSAVDKGFGLWALSASLICFGVSLASFFNLDPWPLSLGGMIFIHCCVPEDNKAVLFFFHNLYFSCVVLRNKNDCAQILLPSIPFSLC